MLSENDKTPVPNVPPARLGSWKRISDLAKAIAEKARQEREAGK